MTTLSSPGLVQAELEGLLRSMAFRANEHEEASAEKTRLIREWDQRLAEGMVRAEGPNAEVRKANALIDAINRDDLYERLTEAEAVVAACAVAQKSEQERSMICMAILRAQSRA